MTFLKNKLQVFVILVFLAYTAWWVSFQPVVENQGLSVQWFGATYGVLALIGAVIGFFGARKWGGAKAVIGRALLFFSLGLLAQEAGQIIYTYYIYVSKIQIPYPSLGDVAYFGSVILYIYATALLAKAAGVKFSLKSFRYKVLAITVFTALLFTSFWFFLHNHEYDYSQPITVALDFGYPIGQALYISLALTAYLLSRKLLGGVMRAGIVMVIFALAIQYIADFTFLYQSSRGTWLTGRYNDWTYLLAYFALTTAMIKFHTTYRTLKPKNPVESEKV